MVNTPSLLPAPLLGVVEGEQPKVLVLTQGGASSKPSARAAAAEQERLPGEGPAVSTAGSVMGRGSTKQPTGRLFPLQSENGWRGHGDTCLLLPVLAAGTWESPRGSCRVLRVPKPVPGSASITAAPWRESLGMCHGFRTPRVAAEHLLHFCIGKNPTKPVPRTQEPLETGLQHLKYPRFCPLALLVASGRGRVPPGL